MSAYDDDNDNDDQDVDDVDAYEVWERPRLQCKWWSGWLIMKFTNICFRWIDEYIYWYDLNVMTIMIMSYDMIHVVDLENKNEN